MAGRLLAERAIEDGADFTLGNNLMKVAEMEFAFRFGEDLEPRAAPYSQREVLARVSALHPPSSCRIPAISISKRSARCS
jgi:2-keto-4-pentenoate hydratase